MEIQSFWNVKTVIPIITGATGTYYAMSLRDEV
jgi:hypothetical protein